MRASSGMKLLAACFGGCLMSMPPALVDAKKAILDLRPPGDFGTELMNCANAEANRYRYIQVEVFDYNDSPWVVFNYRQVADECGNPLADGAPRLDETMEYNAADDGDVVGRLQMDMYVCAPFGYYELEVTVKSTNGNKPMEKVAWEIEYGADEYHIWDTLNSPFYGRQNDFFQLAANGQKVEDRPYAPIPPKYDGGDGVTYKWPYSDAKGYYSHMYTGPFPPLMCDNLLPGGVQYEGCYAEQSGWTEVSGGPTAADTNNNFDIAERFRMYDGLLINDSDPNEAEDLKIDRVMSPERCAELCNGYSYFGLSTATKCACGNDVSGDDLPNCGLEDGPKLPEYEYLCSGDSRFLCGTDTMYSIYSMDGTGPTPTPPTPTPPTPTPPTPTPPTPTPPGDYDYAYEGCAKDSKTDRVMTLKTTGTTMSAEICAEYCVGQNAGYVYFGTEFGNECWCSVSIPNGLDLKHNRCGKDCANNVGEKCGGYNAISVYKIGEAGPGDDDEPGPTPAPVTPQPAPVTPDNPTPSGGSYEPVDCFKDNRGSPRVRIMGSKTDADNMTPELCAGLCNDGTNTHFGNQYGRECWCANDSGETSIRQHGTSTNCNYECSGDAGEDCGGWNLMSVYRYT